MAKELNFATAKKKFLTITFIDGEKILVRVPTKRIMDELVNMKSAFEELESQEGEEKNDSAALDEIYEITADIMSNNIKKKKIEVDYLSEVLDIEDLMIFFNTYMDFVNELKTVKN